MLEQIQTKIDQKTKPIGALGKLETLAIQIASVQNSLSPNIDQKHFFVFAGDHGIAKEGVSPYPQEVTFQMVMNFLDGGAAINVFANQHKIPLTVVDCGVNYDFKGIEGLVDKKIAFGTKSYLEEPAMTEDQMNTALLNGKTLVREVASKGVKLIGCGEMGIGNTSSASIIMHKLLHIPLDECVGAGTGLDVIGIQKKYNVLQQAVDNHKGVDGALEVLRIFGGFEVATMVGAYLEAVEKRQVILVDGFISSAAALIAVQLNPKVKDNMIFTHKSNEKGHQAMMKHLNVSPLLDLGMRLGEGSGAAVALPLIESAVKFFNEMASFESASVSEAL